LLIGAFLLHIHERKANLVEKCRKGCTGMFARRNLVNCGEQIGRSRVTPGMPAQIEPDGALKVVRPDIVFEHANHSFAFTICDAVKSVGDIAGCCNGLPDSTCRREAVGTHNGG
jgi:hypothetical protein